MTLKVSNWSPPTWIMAPKQRLGKGKKPSPASSAKPREESDEDTTPTARTTDTQQKRGGRCSSLLKKCGYFSLIIIVPTVLNYAALSQEAKALVPEGQSKQYCRLRMLIKKCYSPDVSICYNYVMWYLYFLLHSVCCNVHSYRWCVV